MKTTLTSLFVLAAMVLQAQFTIPNADFETWEFNGWNYSPTSWTTGNTNTFEDTYQDSLPYAGQLAMRVEPQATGLGEYGEARIEIPTQAIPASLDFWVKYERTVTAYMGVSIEFYNEENMFYYESWQAPDTVSDWVYVSLPLDQIEPVMTHAIIRVQASVGDLVAGDGWIAVDDMSVGGTVDSVVENDLPGLDVYPNPASQTIYIDFPTGVNEGARTRLIDSRGRSVIDLPSSSRVPVGDLPTGTYILQVISDAGHLIGMQRVAVE